VLVVEDDADCQEAIVETLEALGFSCARASSGDEALRLWLDDPALGCALCDLSLPDINGASLAVRLHRHRPGARIAVLSGYERAALDEEQDAAIAHWFRKPIDIHAIAGFVAGTEALRDEERPTPGPTRGPTREDDR
jgi:CheY-like chemotaxis protein